ncbi:MAG: immunoglobulin-like domain-containing protein [Myxococcota bacterium]
MQLNDGGSANVLIWEQYTISNAVATSLQGMGHTVTTEGQLPQDLSSYDVIWHFGAFSAPTAQEQTRLADFLAAGGGLHMTGERPCCDDMNDGWDDFVAAVVIGGDSLTIGRQGDISAVGGGYASPYQVNQDVQGQVAGSPHQVDTLHLAASGGIDGLDDPDNILAIGNGSVPVGAVWDSADLVGNAGRLSLIMDVNWVGSTYFPLQDNESMLQNLQVFLQGGQGSAPIADAGFDQSADCLLPGEDIPVDLDGTGSSDADGDPLTYAWYEDDVLIATGATPTVFLPPGDHTITLVVNDGSVDSDPDSVAISLVADSEAPWLNVLGDNPAVVECGSVYLDDDAIAGDSCSGDLTSEIVTMNNVDTGAVGGYSVDYEVTDDAGLSASATRAVEVQDTTPPVVEVTSMMSLWPPDHTYHEFSLDDCVESIDEAGCTPLDASAARIDAIYSDELENGIFDGDTEDDIVIVDDQNFLVRAERKSGGDGRVYGVEFTVTDGSGNSTSATCYIGVRHDWDGGPAVDSGPSYTVVN